MAKYHFHLHGYGDDPACRKACCVEVEADSVRVLGDFVVAEGPTQPGGGRTVLAMFKAADLSHVYDVSKGREVPPGPPTPPEAKKQVYGHGAPKDAEGATGATVTTPAGHGGHAAHAGKPEAGKR